MEYENRLVFDSLMQEAENRCADLSKMLGIMDDSLEGKRDGKTRGRIVGAFFVSIFYLVVFILLFVLVKPDSYILYIGIGVFFLSFLLVLSMIADQFIQMRYYGAVIRYKQNVDEMKQRIESASRSLGDYYDEFMRGDDYGWAMDLDPEISIYEEAEKIEDSMLKMRKLTTDFLHKAKNILLFPVALGWTVFVPLAGVNFLTRYAQENGTLPFAQFFHLDTSYQLEQEVQADVPSIIVIAVVLLLACVAECFLLRAVWVKTNCAVTNLTVLPVFAGPFLPFLVGIIGGAILVILETVIIIIGVIFVVVIIFGVVSAIFGN